ncbi:hypothetical protein J0A94_09215 [Paraclostridium bifermentans]|uniref:Uncharacterized protein n=1 Tax=Paraclostridium bifermentans TaxID=1490 RepID=A0AA44DI41_PARBF|nr:polysialyltransferase family glycosyltransferase [Paraclostridium bifermentans]MBN8048016.1 hypothetical protein [Paraclostridium bifermentans]NME08148.1 hypothetical protein [Paraclostridium bifermentans]
MKKVLFLTFTPYHIKLSNYLISEFYNEYQNFMIVSSFSGIEFSKLESFIDKERLNLLEYYNLNYEISSIIKKPLNILGKYKKDLSLFMDSIEKYNPDTVVFFSDEPIPYQILFDKIKDKKNMILVEEGIGSYSNSRNSSMKSKIQFNIRKLIFKYNEARRFGLCKGGYENVIIALEPQLINPENKNINRIQIDKLKYKKFVVNENLYDKDIIKLKNASLLCPCCTSDVYTNKAVTDVFNKIFNKYEYDIKKHIYIKLHPADKNRELIINISKKYKNYIHFINEDNITSEDLLSSKNLDELISDFSSTLINTNYINPTIELKSYYSYLCNILSREIIDNNLFKYLLESGKIKDMTL